MIQGRVDRKEGGIETGRGLWGGGDWDGETGETEMGRRRGRWRRAGKGQEWEGKGEAGGWTIKEWGGEGETRLGQ